MDIGFIGLGSMGMPMVNRLLDAGYKVVICDVNNAALEAARKKGALIAASPKELADLVETVLVSLPTPQIVFDVAVGHNGLREGKKIRQYIDLSTTGAVTAKKVADFLSEHNIRTLDAPVSGGAEGAENGTLAIMCAGEKELFDTVSPLLKVLGKNTLFIGETVGQGQSIKLVNNFLVSTSIAAASEAMVLAAKAGLDPKLTLDVINVSSGRSLVTESFFPKTVLPRTFDFGFKINLMHKDVRLCKEEAEELGVSMPICTALFAAWTRAINEGWGDKDMTSLVQMYEQDADVLVKSQS